MDIEPLETRVCVHSPIIEYSVTGGYYTSYGVHLTSNNPCFRRPDSHVRRRYSEFSSLRNMLISHHPTLTPPALPPKNYFHRFNDLFIEERMKGLQRFLTEVLSKPVYLSDKSLHLFLQSTSNMSDITKECLGDIPAPPLINPSHLSYCSKHSSDRAADHCARSLHSLVLDDVEVGLEPQIKISRILEDFQSSSEQPHLTSALRKSGNKPFLIPKRNGSLDSSTSSSPSLSPSSSSSLDTSYSVSPDRAKERRVSFNDTVKVAVVTHYGISVLRP